MAGLRRTRLAVNKRKINARTNTRGDTANKIVVRWLLLVARVLLNITRSAMGKTEERRGEVIREDGDQRGDQKGKIIRWIFIKLNHRARPGTAGSESVFVHCLAHLIANINMFYLRLTTLRGRTTPRRSPGNAEYP